MEQQEIRSIVRKVLWDLVEIITSKEEAPISTVMPRIEYLIEIESEKINGMHKKEINAINEANRQQRQKVEKELKIFIKMFNSINKTLKIKE